MVYVNKIRTSFLKLTNIELLCYANFPRESSEKNGGFSYSIKRGIENSHSFFALVLQIKITKISFDFNVFPQTFIK